MSLNAIRPAPQSQFVPGHERHAHHSLGQTAFYGAFKDAPREQGQREFYPLKFDYRCTLPYGRVKSFSKCVSTLCDATGLARSAASIGPAQLIEGHADLDPRIIRHLVVIRYRVQRGSSVYVLL